jgi:hypothetical protein
MSQGNKQPLYVLIYVCIFLIVGKPSFYKKLRDIEFQILLGIKLTRQNKN